MVTWRRFDARVNAGAKNDEAAVFACPAATRTEVESLVPNPEHMFWFEYHFLYVLAAGGSATKAALGDHGQAGYQQRARFYSISDEARLNYSKNVATYLIFLAEQTDLVAPERCQQARDNLAALRAMSSFCASPVRVTTG